MPLCMRAKFYQFSDSIVVEKETKLKQTTIPMHRTGHNGNHIEERQRIRGWILFSPLKIYIFCRFIKKDKASSALQTISQRDGNKERVK